MSMYHNIDIGASFLGMIRFLVLATMCVCVWLQVPVVWRFTFWQLRRLGKGAQAVVAPTYFTPAPLVLGLTPIRYPVFSKDCWRIWKTLSCHNWEYSWLEIQLRWEACTVSSHWTTFVSLNHHERKVNNGNHLGMHGHVTPSRPLWMNSSPSKVSREPKGQRRKSRTKGKC